jgi:thioredoxin reductase (NADPH)
MYDLIVVGAGPAGLTAAVYARRAGKSVMVIEKSSFGGQMTFSPKIENYPGFPEISGNELADRMVSQALGLGAEIDLAEVSAVRRTAHGFAVTADGRDLEAASVIIAAGAEHRRLGLEGEDDLIGKGISFCAVCDGAFYAGKRVAVIGGGNSAIVEASLLAEICRDVTLIQNLPSLTGEKSSAEALLSRPNVGVYYSSVVAGYRSKDGQLTGIRIRNVDTGEEKDLDFDGVFVAIGLSPASAPFRSAAALDANGYVIADETCRTGTPGLFVAGDCRTKAVRQISTAAADGATAALAACAYIDSL